jgi:DNA-binding transcriptional MerR regulator
MSRGDIRGQLERELVREDLTGDELVCRAESLLDVLAPEQTRYKVSERPDVRTIRYYISRSLLPKPFGYEGGRARYGGTHLVRLLFIKRLQAAHYTLQQIQNILEQTDDQALIRQLAADALSGGALRPTNGADLPSPPDPAMGGTAIRRMSLAGRATLDIPRATLVDPDERHALADALERVADQLRNSPHAGGSQ